jgi:hypothetical protein
MDIVARPFYKLPLIGKLKSIELYANDKLLAQCEVAGQGKSLDNFVLVRTDTVDQVIIKFKDKLREEFEIIDNIENCRWTCEFPKSDSWISLAKPMTIKSEKHLGEFSNGGLIYLDDKCIGRIGETSKYLFGRRLTKMEVKDDTYINLLMSICLVKILQDKVYKIHDWGD